MISVIIPTYKSPEMLDLCLRSAIEGQQNKNQIIVVVDGFYDINKEVLEKWSEYIDVLNLEPLTCDSTATPESIKSCGESEKQPISDKSTSINIV
jgi:cellulose synthase/poly-beta-1,6-N-acetylglucosamine synthase-like glycosyltransferase